MPVPDFVVLTLAAVLWVILVWISPVWISLETWNRYAPYRFCRLV